MSNFIPPIAVIAEPAMVDAANIESVSTARPLGEFSGMVSDGLHRVSQQLMATQVDLQHLAAGDAQSLHRVMIGLEESRLSFQLMLQVRNRLLESYQDLMRMQV